MRPLALAFWLSAFAFLSTRTARADDAGPGICPKTSYGMPCDPGDGNACGGVCLPDFSKANAPMSCLVANAAALARLNATAGTLPTWTLTSLDGIGCSPTGFPGTDCAHACSGGVCVAKNASQGAACMPARDDSGIATIPVSVCSGACDGNGTCVALNQACESYGRGAIDECLYIACNVAANAPTIDAGTFAPGCTLFPNPSGVQCSDDPCVSGGTCGSQGDCLGGTRMPNCAEPDVDGSAAFGSAQDGDSPHATTGGGVDAAKSNARAPASSSSSGCATAAEGSNTTSIGAFFLSLAIGAALRRSGSRRS